MKTRAYAGGASPRACSVVIPVRDMERYLGEAIESALAQGPVLDEVIVVDDGSRDGSLARARAYEGVTVLSCRGEGAGAARNEGLARVRSPFVLFLDADDRLRPRALERLAALLEADDKAVVSYGDAVQMDEAGRVRGHEGPPLLSPRPSGHVLEKLLVHNFVTTTGVACVRRSAAKESGGFREDLPRSHDWELWCRLAARGPFGYLGGPPLLERREHAASIGATKGSSVEEALRTVDAVFDGLAGSSVVPANALESLRRRRCASVYVNVGQRQLRARRYLEAREHFARSLRLSPLSLRALALYAASVLRVLPLSLERRLR